MFESGGQDSPAAIMVTVDGGSVAVAIVGEVWVGGCGGKWLSVV